MLEKGSLYGELFATFAQFSNVNARWGQFWFIQPQTFQNKSQNWICLIVACDFMESLQDMAVNKFRKPSILGGEVCFEHWWWMQRNGTQN